MPSARLGTAAGAPTALPTLPYTHCPYTQPDIHPSAPVSSSENVLWLLESDLLRTSTGQNGRNQNPHTHTIHLQSMSDGIWWIHTSPPLLFRQDNSDMYVLHHFPKFPSQIVPQLSIVVTGFITILFQFPSLLPLTSHFPVFCDCSSRKLLAFKSLSQSQGLFLEKPIETGTLHMSSRLTFMTSPREMLLSPFYRWRNQGLEKLITLPSYSKSPFLSISL